jgi:pyruvate dehydrogenase E1 component beta subunit
VVARTFSQAITDAQAEEMRRDPTVFVMGEDVRWDIYGKTTGLLAEFGPERVRDTPISEEVIVGAAIGAAMTGMRPIVDVTIGTFLYLAVDQLVSQASKLRYMFGGQTKVPLLVRAGLNYGGGNAAQHSDRNYPLFMQVPGLCVAVPASPRDAKGLMKTAIRSDDVVVFFEETNISGREEIPDDELIPFGKASVLRQGSDLTIVAIGGSVPLSNKAADRLETMGISVELIDPRTLVPLDEEAILASVNKTGRLILVEPANRTCGATAEIAAIVAERAFNALRAPIGRVTTPQTHVPYSPSLERLLYPNVDRIVAAAQTAAEWRR